jgi:hypothetical protein
MMKNYNEDCNNVNSLNLAGLGIPKVLLQAVMAKVLLFIGSEFCEMSKIFSPS